ncbi:MAG: DNA polymerase alpha catalytic subunit, variant 2 [Marteilia pararefringens]
MRRKAKLIVRMRRDEDEDEELPAEDDNPLREFQDERSAAEESLDEDANDKWLVDDDGNSIDSNDSYYKEYDDESNISDANSELSSEDPSNIKKGEENDAEQRIIANLTSSAIEKSQRKVLKKEQGAAKKRKKNPKSHSNVTKLLNSCGNVADDDNNNNNNNISKHCSRSDIVKSGDQSSFIQDMFEELDLPADKQNVSDTSPCSNQNFGIKTDPEADEFLAAFNKKVPKDHLSPDTVENLSLFPEKLGNIPVPKLNQKIESFIATVSEDDEKTRPNSNCPPGNAQGLSRSVTLEDHVSPREDIETPSKSNLAAKFVDSDFYITDVIDYYYEMNNTIYLFGMLLDQNKRALQKCCIRCYGFMKSVLIRPRPEFTGTNNDLLQEFGRLFIKSDCIQMLKHEETKKSIVFTDFSQNEKILEIYYKPSFLKVPILNKVNSDKILEIFGASDTTIEQFLIRTKLRLPQWIVIQNMTVSDDRTSWCNVELMMDYCYESSLNIQISTDDCEIGDKKLEIRFSAITLSLIKYYNSESNTVHIIGFSLLSCQDFNPAEDYEESNFKYRVISISPLPDGTKLPYDWNLYIKSKGLKNFNSENLPNERAVLGSMLAKIQSIDPDIIFGYDILDGDAKLLLSRLKSLKVPFFSKLGRLRISNYQSVSNRQSKYVAPHLKIFAGRLIADVLIFAKELTNIISYSLVELFKSLNPDNKEQNDYSPDINTAIIDNITKDCFEDSSKLHEVICLAFMRNIHILKISENLLFFPLVCKLSSICGMTLSKVLQGGRAIRCEFLLLHAFYNQSIIPPEISRIPARNDDLKEDSNEEHTSNKAKYSGGIVLEPEIGFYPNYISVLDFNSLYPSLMMEYNICFTTLLPLLHSKGLIDSNDETEWIEVCKNEMVQALTNSNSTKMALLPSEIKNLVDKRREIKRKISQKSVPSANNNSRDLTELKHLNIEQQALKLTANSIYGCLGFKNSRFFAQKLAQMITKTGRDALLTAKAQSEKIGYNVIYGDTDSIMINIKDKHTSLEVVQSISQRICNVINGKFRILRIGVDHLYKNMLLIRKKKYAALAVSSPEKNGNSLSFSKEMKGLDIVRRDWSKIAKEVGNKVLDEILAAALGMEENIISILQQYSKKIRTDTIPLDSYQIFRNYWLQFENVCMLYCHLFGWTQITKFAIFDYLFRILTILTRFVN